MSADISIHDLFKLADYADGANVKSILADVETLLAIRDLLATHEDKLDRLRGMIARLELRLSECDDDYWTMRERVDELEAQQRWIPVSERKPEYGKHVLILHPSGGAYIDRYIELSQSSSTGRFWIYRNATHWMPLPTQPTEHDSDDGWR